MYRLSRKFLFIYAILFISIIGMKFLVSWHKSDEDLQDLWDDSYTRLFMDEKFTLDALDENLQKCLYLKDETKYFRRDKQITDDEQPSVNAEISGFDESEHAVYNVMFNFNKLLGSINVKAAIIEPSILYCMLQGTYQHLLISRNFDVLRFAGSKNIVTYGTFRHNIVLLQKEEYLYKFKEAGFQPHFVRVPIADWMRRKGMQIGIDSYVSHAFYYHQNCTIHLVVFVERNNYLWHSALHSDELIASPHNLLFANHDAAYEKFVFVSLARKVRNSVEFYIPSSPQYFLFQMLSSRFLECDMSGATYSTIKRPQNIYPELSVDRFNRRIFVALREVKTIFYPQLMNFWVFGGTLLGWYRQCDIIPYRSHIDLAAWSFEVGDVDVFVFVLLNNDHLRIVMRMGLLEEALEFLFDCHNLRVDISFMYPARNGSWCAIHNPSGGFYSRCYYPHFTLCSGELLGEKIQVPCETENIILSAYGEMWRMSVSEWDYISYSKNRGPFRYWTESKLKDVYQFFNKTYLFPKNRMYSVKLK